MSRARNSGEYQSLQQGGRFVAEALLPIPPEPVLLADPAEPVPLAPLDIAGEPAALPVVLPLLPELAVFNCT